MVERGGREGHRAAALAFAACGRARVVGITGAPGAGKSTLAAALVGHLRDHGERVAVLAIDPSSPVSGGAVLGDRVRMQAHATDPGVFVRSMASRGAPGGLSPAAPDAVRVLDAAGWPEVLVETVGGGQSDTDVGLVADTVVMVVTPGWGDGVQAEKAGVLEIADILVVNKGDRPGADEAADVLAGMLGLVPMRSGWRPPVVVTSARHGHGVVELWEAVSTHRLWSAEEDRREVRRRARLAAELRWVIGAEGGSAGLRRCHGPVFDEAASAVAEGRLHPGAAAMAVLGGADR